MNHHLQKNFQVWVLFCALMFGVTFPGAVFSEDIRLSTTVDKNQLTLEDSIELSVTVHGVRNPPMPELPPLSDFRVRSRGTQSSTQIINSSMRVSTTHKFLLIPKNVGSFKIGSAVMKLDGAIYKSDPITVSVEISKPGRPSINEAAFTETSVSKTDPFVNEQVVYTFKFFRRVGARNLNLSMPDDDTLFRKEDMGKAKRYSQVINGIAYDVHEISIALFPLKAGTAVIPPSLLELDLIYRTRGNRQRDPFSKFYEDPFFGAPVQSDHKYLSTKQIELNIRPLPKDNRPTDFRNLVGRFAISAELGKTELDAGDTTTLTLTVSGTGNIMDVTLAEPDLHGQFKIYPDQPTFKQTTHGTQIGGEKTFKFALVPYSTGAQTIPSIKLSYFDPEKNTYNTVSTRPINLTVRPGVSDDKLNLVQPGSVSAPQNGSSVSILARDILPIHTNLADFENSTFSKTRQFTYATGLLGPIVIYFFAAGYIRYNHRMKDDISYSRRQGAYNIAKKKLEQLSSSHTDSKYFVKDFSQIFREYIGNKLNLQGTAFTAKELEEKLNDNDYKQKQISAVRKLLEKCEAMQYAPVTTGKDNELIDESLNLLSQLEKQA